MRLSSSNNNVLIDIINCPIEVTTVDNDMLYYCVIIIV